MTQLVNEDLTPGVFGTISDCQEEPTFEKTIIFPFASTPARWPTLAFCQLVNPKERSTGGPVTLVDCQMPVSGGDLENVIMFPNASTPARCSTTLLLPSSVCQHVNGL